MIIFVNSCGITFFRGPSRRSSCGHSCLILFCFFSLMTLCQKTTDQLTITDCKTFWFSALHGFCHFLLKKCPQTPPDGVDALLEFHCIRPLRGVAEQFINQIRLLIATEARQSFRPENCGRCYTGRRKKDLVTKQSSGQRALR